MIQTLIPKTGLRCVDPSTRQALPPEGAPVEMSPYWQRRLADGDVSLKTSKPARNTPAAHRGAQE